MGRDEEEAVRGEKWGDGEWGDSKEGKEGKGRWERMR